MKTKLIFVRHGEAEGNFIRAFQGWTDGELTPKGHIQAQCAASKLKETPIDVIYSSSLKRTLQTAQYISEIKNLPIIETEDLREINGGDWEGQPWEVLPKKWPKEHDTWENAPHIHQMPHGESMMEFQQRLIKEVSRISNLHPGQVILIVTHGTAIRAMLAYFRHRELEEMIRIPWCDNTAMTIVDCEEDLFSVIVEGDASHLEKHLRTLENQEWWSDYLDKFKNK